MLRSAGPRCSGWGGLLSGVPQVNSCSTQKAGASSPLTDWHGSSRARLLTIGSDTPCGETPPWGFPVWIPGAVSRAGAELAGGLFNSLSGLQSRLLSTLVLRFFKDFRDSTLEFQAVAYLAAFQHFGRRKFKKTLSRRSKNWRTVCPLTA